jgi:hypothetical protein
MGLAVAAAMAATLAPSAHAQGGAKKLGAVLGVPVQSLGSIVAANALAQNNVSVLHISQNAFGGQNNQIATIAISQRNNAGGNSSAPIAAKIPTVWLPQIQQINLNRVVVNQTSVGNGNTQVADVQVAQSNASAKPGDRYLLVPGNLVGPLLQLNLNLVIVTQVAVGDGNTQVALVSIDQSNGGNLNVPGNAVNPLVQINSNIKVITQVAIGDLNTQIATLNVGQRNG